MGQKAILRKLNKLLVKVKSYDKVMKSYSDEELSGLTKAFKQRLQNGEPLDSLLPEAFAAICEADERVLGMHPYDVQILGGIALHFGYLAEMNTGEGKTLVATMPLYLNALTGKSTLLATTNDYLAIRDAKEMGQVYQFMGLTVGIGAQEKPDVQFTNEEKKAIYACDIVYSTHGSIGFDYLFNNLVTSAEDRFMRPFNYIIVDEADSVLLDAANTPLVISASPRVQSNLYRTADFFVTTLEENLHYEVEDKKVWLTEEGIQYAEEYFRIDNFYGEEHFEINRHVNLALRAHTLMEKEKDYMISRKNELVLLDHGSGRMMPGVKLRGGMHQALEVKEGLEPSQENRSVASITYQNLFKLFPKFGGMSGTISDAKTELLEMYGEQMVVIPTNKPIKRVDLPDRYFKDATSQFMEAIETALEKHATGQPILFVVGNIQETEMVSRILVEERVPHSVLNANNAFWEADIIKEAGQMGAVTVATSMAGRGTDIKLGPGVAELGGLGVIGIGRLGNVRLERQARGRAGRQGDPGFSQFFVALEDEVVQQINPKVVEKYVEKDKHISSARMKRIINKSQKLGEERSEQSRKQATDYDQVMCRQRQIIYEIRNELLDGGSLSNRQILLLAKDNLQKLLNSQKSFTSHDINRYILDHLSYQLNVPVPEKVGTKREKASLLSILLRCVQQGIKEQYEILQDDDLMCEFVRKSALSAIDEAWVEEVDYLQQLQSAVSGRTSAQRNPLYEYERDARLSFEKMQETICVNIVRNILLSSVSIDQDGELGVILP